MLPNYAKRIAETHQTHKALTFGDLIAAAYAACGKRRARAMLRLAVNAHLVEFRGSHRFVISTR